MDKMLLKVRQVWLAYEGKIIPMVLQRWVFTLVLLIVYGSRIVETKGFHVVSYCLAILILNLFLRFLTPIKADLEEEDFDNPVLPMKESDEFKPFLRKLGEFALWKNMTLATLVAVFCTFFEALDLPVFWPVLVMYFVILFVVTMRRQIAHMMKHQYIPFDFGKAKYGGNTEKS